jgi:hypothetical protein
MKGGVSPLASTVKSPLLSMAAVFSCAGVEESITETVLVAVASSDAIPNTAALDAFDATGEFGESFVPQPEITKLNITVHIARRVKTFFLII